MKIVFLYAGGRSERVEAIQTKRAPTEFFYGAIELARLGHSVDILEIQKASGAWVAAYNTLLKWATPIRTNGDDVLGIGKLLNRLQGIDCVVATTTPLALALAIWKKIMRRRIPMVGIHCGILNHPSRGVRRWTTRAALTGSPAVFFAQPEAAAARRFFKLPEIFEVPFGVDTEFWSPADDSYGDYILSVGNDARRDYKTLIAAAEKTELPVKILTSRPLPTVLPSNISVLQGSWKQPDLDDVELRRLYRKARFVVIPLVDSIQPSGQSVALQAMACGKPVILTRTAGLWTGKDFQDNQEILLIPEKNPTALAKQMLELWNNPRPAMGRLAREAVLRTGNIHSFATGILECCSRASCDSLYSRTPIK